LVVKHSVDILHRDKRLTEVRDWQTIDIITQAPLQMILEERNYGKGSIREEV